MPIDLTKPAIWLPPKPAIIRPAKDLAPPAMGMLMINQLIGFGGGAADPMTLTFVASATNTGSAGTTPTVTLPASILNNDILFAVAYQTVTAPDQTGFNAGGSGWEDWIGSGSFGPTSENQLIIGFKRAAVAASDAGASFTLTQSGLGSTSNWEAVALVFRPSRSATSIADQSAEFEFTTGNPSSQTVTASGTPANKPTVVVSVAKAEASTASFSIASPAFDATVSSSDSDMIVGYKIYAANTGVNHTIDINDLGSNYFWSSYLYVNG